MDEWTPPDVTEDEPEALAVAAQALMDNRDNPELFDVFPSQEVIDAATDLARVAINAYVNATPGRCPCCGEVWASDNA